MGTATERVWLSDFSAFNPPPGDHLMAILKAYLDDSGDPRDPQHTVLTVGGFVSTSDGWNWFEHHWPAVMRAHRVPYLHMKEMWNKNGIYKELKESGREPDFFADCIQTIQTATEFCVSATIRLSDLKAFNAECGLSLDPAALALYGCILGLREQYPQERIEIFVDRMNSAERKIALAKAYAETDTYLDLRSDELPMMALAGSDTFRNVLPIQAADLMAWELRKNSEERKTFNPSELSRPNNARFRGEYELWRANFHKKNGRWPHDQRKSAIMLSAWPPASGYLWDLVLIRAAHFNRHKNGWGD